MHKPHGRYDYCTDIKTWILGDKDEEVTLFHDFECEVDIEVKIHNGQPYATCYAVLVDGKSLREGFSLGRLIMREVMTAVETEFEAAGPIWDKVREAEGLTMIGQPGDPDSRWVRS